MGTFKQIKSEPDPRLLSFLSDHNLRYFTANPQLLKRLVPSIESPPKPAFIAYSDQSDTFRSHLTGVYQFRSALVGQYVIFYDLTR